MSELDIEKSTNIIHNGGGDSKAEEDMNVMSDDESNDVTNTGKKKTSGSNRITKTEAQQSMLNRKQKKLVTRLNTAYCRTGKMERILPILTGKSKISLRLIDWFVTNYAKIYNTHYSISEYKIKREGKVKRGKTVAPKTHKKDKILEREREREREKEKEREKESNLLGTSPSLHQPHGSPTQTQDEKIETVRNLEQVFNDLFFVYPSYRQELKTNSKKRFDVFCRNGSFNYYYDDHKFIETNDGQLNFFDWADNMYVIDYIEDHYNEIEKDMELRNGKKPSSQKKTITAHAKKASTIACEKDIETISQKQRRKRREISESSLKTVHHIKHKSIISFN